MYGAYMRDASRCGTSERLEVARHAGVSTATVSRGAAGHERVLPDQRQGAHRGDRAGLRAQRRGPGLAARRTGVLGLVLPDLDQDEGESEDEADAAYGYDEVIRGMERGPPGAAVRDAHRGQPPPRRPAAWC